MKKRKLPTTYRGKLTKKQKQKELQKIVLSFFLTFLIAFGGYLIREMHFFNQEVKAESLVRSHTKPVVSHKDKKGINTPKKENLSTEERILDIAEKENFKWQSYLLRLAYCESRLNPDAINYNQGHGTDRGIYQINDKYHPEVSDECAYDLECATKWTMWRINSGYQEEWACDDIIKNNFDYYESTNQ